MVAKFCPSPRDEVELCIFLSYVAKQREFITSLRSNSRINMNFSHMITFLRMGSRRWTRAKECSYDCLQSEFLRVMWSHKNVEIFCIMRDFTIFFGVSHCVGLHLFKVELDSLNERLF